MSRDQKFFDMYSLVIAVLVVATIGIFVLAMKMSDATQGVYTRETAEYQAQIADRLKPVGQVYLPGEEQTASTVVVAEPEPVATAMTGPQVYNSACLACHASGAGGAPIVGDTTQWGDRIAQGLDTLTQHAIEGYSGAMGYMPAKGGRMDLSDEEVMNAVEYMVGESS